MTGSTSVEGWKATGPYGTRAFIFFIIFIAFIATVAIGVAYLHQIEFDLYSDGLILLVLLIGILTVGIAAFSWFAFWQMTRKTYGRKVLKNWHETNNMLLGMLDKNNIAYMTKSYNRYWLALSQVQNKIVLKESKYWVLLTGRSNSDLSVVYVKDVSMIDYPNLKKFLRLIDSCFPDNKIQ